MASWTFSNIPCKVGATIPALLENSLHDELRDILTEYNVISCQNCAQMTIQDIIMWVDYGLAVGAIKQC